MSLFAGETSILRTEVKAADGATAFALTDLGVTVTKPDGTNIAPDPTVTDTPGGTVVSHVLAATAASTQGGLYKVRWRFAPPGEDPQYRLERYWCYWTNAPGLIRRRLQKTVTELTDEDIDEEFQWVARELLSRYTCAGTYNGLTGDDQDWFDKAAALIVAVRLKAPLSDSESDGALLEWKQGDESKRFAALQPGQMTESQKWASEATYALGRISCIKDAITARGVSTRAFQITGGTRRARTQGYPETLLSTVLRIVTDSRFTGDYS